MSSKGRGNGRTLTDEQVRAIRASDDSTAALGREYGLADNVIRAIRLGLTYKDVPGPEGVPSRFKRGACPDQRKMSPEQVRAARAAFSAGTSQASLARTYGVTPQAMSDLLKGKTYKDID